MKGYEKSLLNSIQGEYKSQHDESLSNIKKGMGTLRHVVGNPMFKAEITLQINSYFFGGAAPFAPGAIPANLQTMIPVYLLGLTDFYGGFQKSALIISPIPQWVLGTNIGGFPAALVGEPAIGIFGVTRSAVLNLNTVFGDLVINFVAPWIAGAPAGCEIVVHCNNVAYGTFLNSFVSDLCVCNQIRYNVPAANINQLINPIIFGYQTLFGKLYIDSIDPRMYQTPGEFQNQIADLPVKFPIDKNIMLNFYLNVFCQQIFLTFFIEKVEPLTLRNKYI